MIHRFQWHLLVFIIFSSSLMSIFAQDIINPTPEVTPIVIDGAIGPNVYDNNINPLTGLIIEDEQTLDRRPIIVKVSNSPAIVRPQSGISQADIVFEHYTEVGITRFSAIFYGKSPARVGSIRSARLIDYELVPMYRGLLAFAGASVGVDKRIYGTASVADFYCQGREDFDTCYDEVIAVGPIGDLESSEFAEQAYKGVLFGAPLYFRDNTIPIPHNLFVNLQALWERAEQDGNGERPELQGLAFHDEPQGDGDGSGIYAQIRYETTLVEWHYDTDTNKYYRSSDLQPHFDSLTNTQVSADNVIIIYAGHYLTDIVESEFQNTIHWSEQITVWPEGEAIILRDGIRYEGQWIRPSRPEMLQFRTLDGDILYLKPGNTWVQLVRLPEQMNPETEWVIVE